MGRLIVAAMSPRRRRDLRLALESDGHRVAEAATAHDAIDQIDSRHYDALILDSDIESGDPQGVCRTIRAKSDLGIIVLIRKGAGDLRIDALNAGADDFLFDGFGRAEFLARVRAIIRRLKPLDGGHNHIFLQDRAINLRSRKVHGPGSHISRITPKEFLVLNHLIARSDQPVNHRELAQKVWQRNGDGDLEFVRVVIAQLRRKIERNHNRPECILTEHSIGYRFKMPVASTALS